MLSHSDGGKVLFIKPSLIIHLTHTPALLDAHIPALMMFIPPISVPYSVFQSLRFLPHAAKVDKGLHYFYHLCPHQGLSELQGLL